jgi:hypothetical protein
MRSRSLGAQLRCFLSLSARTPQLSADFFVCQFRDIREALAKGAKDFYAMSPHLAALAAIYPLCGVVLDAYGATGRLSLGRLSEQSAYADAPVVARLWVLVLAGE